MDQEAQYVKKRLMDLSRRAEEKNLVTYTNFLNLNELNIFHQIKKELYGSFEVFGGYEHAERQMVAFFPDALSYAQTHAEEKAMAGDFPIHAVRIVPAHPKFAEQLTHRDVLGALMNLGIKREMLGDILMREKEIIVLCVDTVSSYLAENCTKMRHTSVDCRVVPMEDFSYEPKWMEKESIVSSLRLDTILADVCKLPRSAAQKIINEGNAFIDSKKIQNSSYNCQNGDILSVRHYGKFQIETTDKITKKGRIKYKYKIYT